MLAEAHKANFVDECSKMKTLSSSRLPELIKSFELKANEKKDSSPVARGRPAAKMKLRDAREVLEIARLKVLVSEMREKTMKMEAQLKSAAEKCDNQNRKSQDGVQDDRKDVNARSILQDFDKTSMHEMYMKGGNAETKSASQDDRQDMPDATCGIHVAGTREQVLELDKDIMERKEKIESLQSDLDQMLFELSTKTDLQEELEAAKRRIRMLQEEIRDDASQTKAQLNLLKQQFVELEGMKNGSVHKELEIQKASSILEAEVAELKKGNQEFLKQKEELSKNLLCVLEKAEKFTPVTKDDILAAEAEVSKLRLCNIELQKKVESLQMSRFNEVEELVYLRWVNACLRHDLDTFKSSGRHSGGIFNHAENCSPTAPDKNDHMLHNNSSHSSTSYNDDHGYPASQNDSEDIPEENECSIESSSQIATMNNHPNGIQTSPVSTRYGQMNINISPLVIPNGMQASPVSTRYRKMNINISPLVIPNGHLSSSPSPPPASQLSHMDNIHSSPTGAPHSCKASPQDSLDCCVKNESNALHLIQHQSHSDQCLSQSPEVCTPQQYTPPSVTLERNPQKIAETESVLKFSSNQSAKLDARSSITNYRQDSLRSFTRSVSAISASSDESMSQIQRRQDRRTLTKSSTTISADSDISIAGHNTSANSFMQLHSASSGKSLLDEYLLSTETRSHYRPASRFSAVLPPNRQLSDLGSVPFPTMKKVTEPLKKEDSTIVKAHSFESHLDASERVVVAFKRLSTSTQTSNTHRTFKDLSRQKSYDEKAVSKVDQHDKLHVPTTRSTQMSFLCDLARAVQVTHYNSIDQVAAFVGWFDRQEDAEKQEFLKFPDCPRDKVEAMRQAVHEYEELQMLEIDLDSYKNKLKGNADVPFQNMKTLLEKVENHVQGFKQARELVIAQYKKLDIPTYWMLDSGMLAKIKQAALKLARRYIRRVSNTLNAQAEPKGVSKETLLLEAARFLLQIHNFAGGFDEKTANVFKVLQSQADLQEHAVACHTALPPSAHYIEC